jgi:hypothetical protein
MFELEELKEIIKGEPSNKIKEMRNVSVSYIRHFFGLGTDEYLSVINEYENERQHKLRKQHAIKNPWILDELLRPIDNIWQAKGGDIDFKFKGTDKSEEIKEKLKDVRGGRPMRQFMREIWFQRFISDPNGVIFLEIEEDGENPHFTYKSITKIRYIDAKGSKIEKIVFEPYVEVIEKTDKEEVKKQFFWAVDELNYYKLIYNGKEVELSEIIPHYFGRVPGVINSPIYNTEFKRFDSLIDKQVDLLNSYLTKNSVKEIYQFKHNYPVFWQYMTICPTCNGKRKVGSDICPTCKGEGHIAHKDVSDVLILPKSTEEERTPIPPAGYVQPDIATCGENRTELDWLFDKMFHSLWGTTVEKSDNETATGRFIDSQPVYNKLNEIADIAQSIEQQLIYIYGKFFFPETLESVRVSYPRRYVIESPDALWKRYDEARKGNAPVMALNYMLEQFYYSEFSSNVQMAEYYIKLMYVEPYPHKTIEEVQTMSVTDEIKMAKQYFPEWEKTKQVKDIEGAEISVLRSDLINYSKENGKQTEIPGGSGAE